MARSRPYHDELIEALKDHDEAVAYLNAAFEEGLKGDKESQTLLLNALKNVAEAQGGLNKLAKKAELKKENLDRMFSARANSQLRTFITLFAVLGFNLRVA